MKPGLARSAGAAMLFSLIGGCKDAPKPAPPPKVGVVTSRQSSPAEIPAVRFTDVTDQSGIRFVHFNGARGKRLLPETMGSGCAFFDYDADGDPDLLFVNGCPWPGDPAPPTPPTCALYRNDGSGHFTDVTTETGLNITFYGMGVTIGDYDNDGFPDIFLTGVGRNIMLHNEGGKRFVDVTATAGVAGEGGWSTGATFFDYDNDGKLDLWVCDYVRWTPEIDLAQDFQISGLGRAYGPPMNFAGAFCTLYHGDGKGHFADVSASAGVQIRNPNTGVPVGKSLGVVTCDFDRDGLTDVFVANDTVQNFLYHNHGPLTDSAPTFEECGVRCGVAFDETGSARGAMGVDAADFLNDAQVGIAVANFANEMTALYAPMDADHPLDFADAALVSGIGAPSRLLLKFGLFFFDYDLDGRLDVLSANGHLEPEISKVQASQQYAQPAQLFWNCGPGASVCFVEATKDHVGGDLVKPIVGRGSAYADIDGDGDLDVCITANGGRPLLLRNECSGRNWVRLLLVGTRCNRDALGARVELHAGGVVQRREVRGASSYLSQSERVLTFGLGKSSAIEKIVVHWPGGGGQLFGGDEVFSNVQINKLSVLKQGTAR